MVSEIQVSVNLQTGSGDLDYYKTLRLISEAINVATKEGLAVELNLSYDESIKDGIKNATSNLSSKVVVNKCTTEATDIYFAEKNSRGDYVLAVRSGDLFTENFIAHAYRLASKEQRHAIYIPGFTIGFKADHYLLANPSSSSEDFSVTSLIEKNHFSTVLLIHREVLDSVSSKGKSEWLWTLDAVAAGSQFVTVPETMYFKRHKAPVGVGEGVQTPVLEGTLFIKPETFVKIHRTIERQTNSKDKNMGRSYKTNILQGSRKYESFYLYAKAQYVANRDLYRAIAGRLHAHRHQKENMLKEEPKQRLFNVGFSARTIEQWAAINKYEPMIRASADMLEYIPIKKYPSNSHLADSYYDFCKKYLGKTINEVVLVPHLVRGGADLAALNLVRALSRMGRSVLVVTTLDTESPWLEKIAKQSNVFTEEGRFLFSGLTPSHKSVLLALVTSEWVVKNISIINSEVGYRTAEHYGREIKKRSNSSIFLHTYAYDMTNDGFIFNYIPDGVVDAYPAVDSLVTDSEGYRQQLLEINGFSKDKVKTLYLPVQSSIVSKKNYKTTKKVLWASRVCDAKLVDVLIEIGKSLSTKGIELHIFGSLDEEYSVGDSFTESIKGCQKIVYHGSYEDFGSIDFNEYDMFLLTSKNEGMPNVVLEACIANLFVIAPSVGGVADCIEDGENGNLVENRYKSDSYVKEIARAYDEKSFASFREINDANKKVVARHSSRSYEKAVKALMSI